LAAAPRTLRGEIVRASDQLRVHCFPGFDAPPTRLFGAVPFAWGTGAVAPWHEFGDGYFVLPQWTYFSGDQGAGLLWVASSSGDTRAPPGARDLRVLGELDRLYGALTRPEGVPKRRKHAVRVTARAELGARRWIPYVESIRRGIGDGAMEKVVAARATRLTLSRQVDPVTVFGEFLATAPDRYCFLFCSGRSAFVGATPELLFAKRGSRLESHALAVTADVGDGDELTPRAREILGSEKSRREHAIVVRYIVDAISPLCMSFEQARLPRPRRFGRLVHLDTEIRGELRANVSAVELLRALHPTPAVAGLPKAAALRWIARHEPTSRGLYAGAAGYVDATGDAEFVVAIRSGLVRGKDAYVFAGAGIVRDSDPVAEFAETRAKQQPFLRALEVRT
jgi:salicylate biosynthesis isochorismate synthase